MRIAVEQVIAYRYMLNMLGIPVKKKTLVMCNNISVVQNTTLIGSPLRKKHCAVSYHRIREAVAGSLIVIKHVRSERNRSDILTKPLGGKQFTALAGELLFRDPAGHRMKLMRGDNFVEDTVPSLCHGMHRVYRLAVSQR